MPRDTIRRTSTNCAIGLSPTTINRNLDYLNQLFTKARSECFGNVASLNMSGLRQRKTTRDRDDRPAFSAPDVQKLFLHPVWQGRASKGRWTEAGATIIKDGLYWLPIIAALTRARREETVGLKQDDLGMIEGISALHIPATCPRTNAQPARREAPASAARLSLNGEERRLSPCRKDHSLKALGMGGLGCITWLTRHKRRRFAGHEPMYLKGSPLTWSKGASLSENLRVSGAKGRQRPDKKGAEPSAPCSSYCLVHVSMP